MMNITIVKAKNSGQMNNTDLLIHTRRKQKRMDDENSKESRNEKFKQFKKPILAIRQSSNRDL
jgi:hypothetical protein